MAAVFRAETIEKMSAELSSHMLLSHDDQNDISDTACRALVSTIAEIVDDDVQTSVNKLIVPRMIEGLKQLKTGIRRSFILEVLEVCFRLHGSSISWAHADALVILTPLIATSEKQFSRKVMTCLSALCPFLSREMLDSFIIELENNFKDHDANEAALVSTLKTIQNIR